jgi:DNA repair exonuclease SbcCD ATPase subunit
LNAIDSTLGVPVSDYTDEARLRELAEAATPGEWRFDAGYQAASGTLQPCAVVVGDDDTLVAQTDTDGMDYAREDAEFIAAANPIVVLSLLAELSLLREQNANLRESAETAVFVANNLGDARKVEQDRRENDRLHYDAEVNVLRAERDALQAEVERLREDNLSLSQTITSLNDEADADEAALAALQARIDALAEDWRSLLAIGKTPFNETTDAQLQRWRTELDILGVYSVLDRIDAANIAAWIEYRAAVGVGVDPQNGEAEV